VALLPTFDPAGLLDLLESRRRTLTFALPAGMQFVAAEQDRHPRDLTSMTTWLSGSDTVLICLQQWWQRLSDCPLLEGYGMSESLTIAFNQASASRQGSLGLPAAKVEVRAIDFDETPVADGETGELAVRSPANFVGYWNDPEALKRTVFACHKTLPVTSRISISRQPSREAWLNGQGCGMWTAVYRAARTGRSVPKPRRRICAWAASKPASRAVSWRA